MYLKPNTHRQRRRDETVELHRVGVGGVNTIRNYSSRRLPTDSVDNLENDSWDSIAVWLREGTANVGHDPVYNSTANAIEVRYD